MHFTMVDSSRMSVTAALPLQEIVTDFFDKLKEITSGERSTETVNEVLLFMCSSSLTYCRSLVCMLYLYTALQSQHEGISVEVCMLLRLDVC